MPPSAATTVTGSGLEDRRVLAHCRESAQFEFFLLSFLFKMSSKTFTKTSKTLTLSCNQQLNSRSSLILNLETSMQQNSDQLEKKAPSLLSTMFIKLHF